MDTPNEAVNVNTFPEVDKVPDGKKIMFVDSEDNSGGTIQFEKLRNQIASDATDPIARAQIENLARLPEGSTTGDAELSDIRVGADGTQYPNAGAAVREQIKSARKNADEAIASLKEEKINKPKESDNNKIARAKKGEVEWVDVGQPTDDQTADAVTKWLDEHPEATTTVQDEIITENKINPSFLPWIKKDYVIPEMFGAVGDGKHDDTKALQLALNASTIIVFSKKVYKCNERLDVSDKIIYGFDATIDFADYTGTDCVISTGNRTNLNNINICNTMKASGYALKLLYIANHGNIENIQIRNCRNGMYISGAWYNNFSNIQIQSSDSESGICLMFGNEKYENAANGIVFSNIFLHGGAYGILFKNITVNSIGFNGITVEQQSKCGIVAENTNGNISLSSIYFEGCALTSEYPLLNVGSLMTNISNVLIRGKYTNCVNAYSGSRIIQYGYIYNPSNIKAEANFNVVKYTSLKNTSYPAITLSPTRKVEGFYIEKLPNTSSLLFKIILRGKDDDFAVIIRSFGNLPEDTSASFYDKITIYIKTKSNYPKAYLKADHIGERDLSGTYTIEFSKDIAADQREYTLNLGNTNGYYAKYNTINDISVVTKSSDIVKIEESSVLIEA